MTCNSVPSRRFGMVGCNVATRRAKARDVLFNARLQIINRLRCARRGGVAALFDLDWGRRTSCRCCPPEVEEDARAAVGSKKKSHRAVRFAASSYASRSYLAAVP